MNATEPTRCREVVLTSWDRRLYEGKPSNCTTGDSCSYLEKTFSGCYDELRIPKSTQHRPGLSRDKTDPAALNLKPKQS